MNKIQGWKRIVLICILILTVLRIGYIGFRGEVDKKYYKSAEYDLSTIEEIACQDVSETFFCNKNRLNSLELIFNNIADDKTGKIILSIWNKDELIYQTNISLNTINNMEWKRIVVNAEMRQNTEYTIKLNTDGSCTQLPTVLVTNGNAASEIASSYIGEQKLTNGSIVINYGYLTNPRLIDKLSIISLWLFFDLAVAFVLANFEKIMLYVKKIIGYITSGIKLQTLIAVLELFGCSIIINCSGIDFHSPTKIVLYLISLISILQFEQKKKFVDELINSNMKKVFLYIIYFYASFALVGQRILIYPLTLKLTIAGVFVFFISILWFVPVVNTVLYFLEAAWKNWFVKQPKIETFSFIRICALVLLLPAFYNLLANNPGISSADTYVCMVQNARNLHGMYDWHPAFYCMVLRMIMTVCDSTYAVIAVQYFFWAYVLIELLLYLRKKGVKESVLICVAVFSGFNASNFLHINTIWKDIPYTLSVLWVFIILAKLSIDYEEYRHKWYIYFELIVSMLGVYFYRKNGVVSFVIIAIALVTILRKNTKVLGSILIIGALIFTIKGPVYSYFEVEDPGRHGIYIGLGQDILGVYYAGGEVSESTLKMITMMTNYNNAEYTYTPTSSNASYDVDVPITEFVFNYIDTFVKNPIIMTRAIIDREDAIWDIFLGKDSRLPLCNYYGTMDHAETWNDYYPVRKYTSLYSRMSAFTDYTANSQWISAIVWRCGLFTLLGVVSTFYVILKKGCKRYLVILAPIIGHVMSLLLSTGWSDFRYFWPMNLMNMALILIALVVRNQNFVYVTKRVEKAKSIETKRK